MTNNISACVSEGDAKVNKFGLLELHNFMNLFKDAIKGEVLKTEIKINNCVGKLISSTENNNESNIEYFYFQLKALKSLHIHDIVMLMPLLDKSMSNLKRNSSVTYEELALTQLRKQPVVDEIVSKFKEKYPNWSEELPKAIKRLGSAYRKRRLLELDCDLKEAVVNERKGLQLLRKITGLEISNSVNDMLQRLESNKSETSIDNSTTKATKTKSKDEICDVSKLECNGEVQPKKRIKTVKQQIPKKKTAHIVDTFDCNKLREYTSMALGNKVMEGRGDMNLPTAKEVWNRNIVPDIIPGVCKHKKKCSGPCGALRYYNSKNQPVDPNSWDPEAKSAYVGRSMSEKKRLKLKALAKKQEMEKKCNFQPLGRMKKSITSGSMLKPSYSR